MKKTIKTKIVTVTGTMDVRRAYEEYFGRRRPTKTLVLSALQQMGENAVDAKATEIVITYSKKEHGFRFADNGTGFLSSDMKGWFDLHTSRKAAQKDFIGQFGTGRAKALRFAEKIVVTSVTAEHLMGITSVLGHEELWKLFSEHRIGGEWQPLDALPSWWPHEKGQTGTVLELVIPDEGWKWMPDADRIIAELAGFFKPSTARRIRVNGRKLKERPMIGRPIIQTFDIPALGGMCEVELYIPSERAKWDEVRLGGASPICTLKAFADGLEDSVRDLVPELLTNQTVAGDIFVPGLNKHCGEDRKSLRDTVYQGFHTELLRFFHDTLGPVLDEAYTLKEQEDRRREKQRMLTALCESLNPEGFDPRELGPFPRGEEGPAGPSKRKPPEGGFEPIVVNRKRIKLMPGETQPLRVIWHLPTIRPEDLVWDDARSGGVISATEGRETVYTAGQNLGEKYPFSLMVSDRKHPEHQAEVKIAIIPSRQMQVSPAETTIEQGGYQEFRVKNADMASGKMKWELKGEQGVPRVLRLRNATGLQTVVEVGERCPLGKYTLRTYDEKDPMTEAFAQFEVTQGDFGNILQIRDDAFELRPALTPQGSLVVLSIDSHLDTRPGSKRKLLGRIDVNFDHQDFKEVKARTTSPEAWLQLLLSTILVAYLDAQMKRESIDPDDILTEFHRLRQEMMAQRPKK